MNTKKQPIFVGKSKIILGAFSLLTVFSTPYLNITQFSLSMDLLQSALYSLVLLGFWVCAARLLRSKQPAPHTTVATKENRRNHLSQHPTPTL